MVVVVVSVDVGHSLSAVSVVVSVVVVVVVVVVVLVVLVSDVVTADVIGATGGGPAWWAVCNTATTIAPIATTPSTPAAPTTGGLLYHGGDSGSETSDPSGSSVSASSGTGR